MIGQSLPEYISMYTTILYFRLVTPLSIVYLCASYRQGAFIWSQILGAYALAEALFYVCFYLPRRFMMQQAAKHPPRLSKEKRQELWDKCVKSMTPTSAAGWFVTPATGEGVRRGNAVEWLLWSLFSTQRAEMLKDWEEELEYYVSVLGDFIGYPLAHGSNPDARSLRLTLDPVVMVHRPLVWYGIVCLADTVASCAMFYHGFQHHNTQKWFKAFPPRPLLSLVSLVSTPSPDPDIPYWYREHRSKDKLPILFILGIGIGMWPYTRFLSELIAQDPDVGILAIEILPVSMHITSPPLSRDQMCNAVASILDAHDLRRVVIAAHSYGTVITAHLHHSPSLAPRIAATLLIDPIPFLLHHPAVAYNFVYRQPREANEWQLWFFASRDADIARALGRHFFWHENILFKEDLEGRRLAVSLSEKDQIVDAPEVWRYLTGQEEPKRHWNEGSMEVLYNPELDHGTVFETPRRRKALLEILGRFVQGA